MAPRIVEIAVKKTGAVPNFFAICAIETRIYFLINLQQEFSLCPYFVINHSKE
jgi:hypothetical protein